MPAALPAAALAEIRQTLAALAAQLPDLQRDDQFVARQTALDELEIHVTDRLATFAPTAAVAQLLTIADELRQQLLTTDEHLFDRLREAIRAGQLPPSAFRALLLAWFGADLFTPTEPVTSYDALDAFLHGLLPTLPPPEPTLARSAEMVYYQQTPARLIGQLATHLAPTDVLYDLGAGLGHVPLLGRLLSGATTRGVEREPAYCAYAASVATALGQPTGQIICADVRDLTYPDATTFFLYTPFTGELLVQVLHLLRHQATRRPLRLFSYGPITATLAAEPWLHGRSTPPYSLYALTEFRSGFDLTSNEMVNPSSPSGNTVSVR